jgi:hypothetical protein
MDGWCLTNGKKILQMERFTGKFESGNKCLLSQETNELSINTVYNKVIIMERIESFCCYSETESLLLLGESLLSLADSADSLLSLGESLPSTRRKFAITRRKKVCSRLLDSMLLLGESFVTTRGEFCYYSEIVFAIARR